MLIRKNAPVYFYADEMFAAAVGFVSLGPLYTQTLLLLLFKTLLRFFHIQQQQQQQLDWIGYILFNLRSSAAASLLYRDELDGLELQLVLAPGTHHHHRLRPDNIQRAGQHADYGGCFFWLLLIRHDHIFFFFFFPPIYCIVLFLDR